jgi:hypothetical protein
LHPARDSRRKKALLKDNLNPSTKVRAGREGGEEIGDPTRMPRTTLAAFQLFGTHVGSGDPDPTADQTRRGTIAPTLYSAYTLSKADRRGLLFLLAALAAA